MPLHHPFNPHSADQSRWHASNEAIRTAQQGRGRPIISTQAGDYTFVAVGDTIYCSKSWKTFADFLGYYLKATLGGDWEDAVLAKTLEERHPLLQWYDAYCRYQSLHRETPGELYSAPMTGLVYCYLGLAYNLYLLKHNVELQARLVARLKDAKQFQGAYYELIVANCMIRAGFDLELEDEGDQETKHCEFAARSHTTGKRYWIEAKMRSAPAVLGKTTVDGAKSSDPTSRLSKHLGEALRKPAADERMIFIDLNTEPTASSGPPTWLDQAVRRLEDRQRNLEANQSAYVFVTNMAFHRSLESSNPGRELLAHGLGLSDFGKPGEIRLSDWYRQKQKHIDAHNLIESLQQYPQIPDTFDGRPASETFNESPRLRVGDSYFFEGVGDEGVVGKVTSVAVIEAEKQAFVLIMRARDGKSAILTTKLSHAEIEDYKKYGDAYFGANETRHHQSKGIFELFEWMVKCFSKTPRDQLMDFAKDRPDIEQLRRLNTEDLLLEVCEDWMSSFVEKQRSSK